MDWVWTVPFAGMLAIAVFLLAASPQQHWNDLGKWIRRYWAEVVFSLLAVGALYTAGAFGLGLETMNAWRGHIRVTAAAVFLLMVVVFSLAAVSPALANRRSRAAISAVPAIFAPAAFLALAVGVAGLGWFLYYKDKLDATGSAGLAAVVVIAIVLSFGGIDLIRRIRKLGPDGIELEAITEDATRLLIPEFEDLDRPGIDIQKQPLSPDQRWKYQRGTSSLLHYHHSGIAAEKLKGSEQAAFRRLVVWVGRAALIENENTKALDVLKLIEQLPDLNSNELYNLGVAYIRAAHPDGERDHGLLDIARIRLQEAIKQDAGFAPAHFALGYVKHYLGQYEEAARHTAEAIRLDGDRFALASWNLADSLVQLEKPGQALDALRRLPPSPPRGMEPRMWWREIYWAEDLKPIREDQNLRGEFWELYRQRLGDPFT